MLKSAYQRGVSLIEVIVVLVIFSALLGTVMPEIRDWMQSLKVRNAAESIKNGLDVARMEALKRNATVGFWLVADSGSKVPGNTCALASDSPAWVVSVSNPGGECGAAASLTASPQLVQRSTALENAAGLTVSATDNAGGAANRVVFNGLGQVLAQAGVASIQFIDVQASSGSTRRLRVVVEPGGAIRMCDRDVAAGDPRVCPVL